jgi:hypothetical protein
LEILFCNVIFLTLSLFLLEKLKKFSRKLKHKDRDKYMKRIIVLLIVAVFFVVGCSDTKKKFLPFTADSGSGTTPTSTGVGTASTASTSVTQATPSCSANPCSAGSVVTITVDFTEAVIVNGVPTLTLNNGQTATYVSGSGTKNLVFTYTVASGDDVLALNYQDTNSLVLSNNSTITLVSTGSSADRTLPPLSGTGSMPATNTLVIDTAVPTISSVSATTANGTYAKDGKVYVTVILSEAVNVTGTPTLTLNTGNATNGTANYVSGSGTNTLTFEYTVRSGDKVADLNYVSTNSLALSGGTIKDAANNVATLTLPATGAGTSLGGAKDIALDTTPTVASITSSTANGTYAAGAVINFTVTFTDSVTTAGTNTITLTNGRTATCTNVTNSTTMSCSYTVQAGDTSSDLTYQNTTSLGGGGTVVSAANPGLAAIKTLPDPTTFQNAHDIVIVALPSISFTAGVTNSVNENVGGGNYSVSFTLSSTTAADVTFNVATGDGTAVAGNDFTGVNQTVTITAGQTTGTLNIPITNDAVYEGNENFTLTMSGPSANAVLSGNNTQTVTITDNETAPTISLTDSTTKTVAEGVGNYTFSVTLSGQSAFATVITVNTANGTATSGSDYTAVSGGTITIPAGSTTGTINIPITDDSLYEGGAGGTAETFTVAITSAATITGGATQTVSITDNETAPTISFTDSTSKTVAESIGTYALSVTLSGLSSTATNVTVNTANGTATSGSDYTAVSAGTLTIPAGQTTGTLNYYN